MTPMGIALKTAIKRAEKAEAERDRLREALKNLVAHDIAENYRSGTPFCFELDRALVALAEAEYAPEWSKLRELGGGQK